MATRKEKQAFLRHYRDVTGNKELNMREVAKLAQSMGWEMPVPSDPLEPIS